MVAVFAVPVFFICFRECLETSIIVSVLLSFLKQTLGPDGDAVVYKKLRRQVWLGLVSGFAIILTVSCGMIGAFYGLKRNVFGATEKIWEGVFALVASLIITAMGAALLRVSKLQDKWRVKLAKSIEAKVKPGTRLGGRLKHGAEKYAMFWLPFITVMREGLEAVIFLGGVGLSYPASAFPLPVFCGALAGAAIGFAIYKGGNQASLQIFLTVSTCFLYLVAAGLFTKSIGFLEAHRWNQIVGRDASETASGRGSYDVRNSVWHVKCCNPDLRGGGGWGVFNSLFGWTNSATYGTVIGYNMYWLAVITGFLALRYNERNGRWPLARNKKSVISSGSPSQESMSEGSIGMVEDADEKKLSVRSTVVEA